MSKPIRVLHIINLVQMGRVEIKLTVIPKTMKGGMYAKDISYNGYL